MSINKKVVWLPYDMDTAIGINNEGELVFDYSLEDIDYQQGGAGIFNGQESVIWKNVRAAFPDELATMYRNLRTEGTLSYANVERRFEDHQSVWAESLFNEDSRFKYIDPFVNEGNNNLGMLQGSKAEQRKWWLYNRFKYLDSKYIAGDSASDTISIRPYAANNISLTPYADIYATIQWDNSITQERCPRNTTVELICPLPDMNDNVVTIYNASQLSSIGDISGLQVGLVNIANATRLQNIKVGDASPNYENTNLRSLTFGNNTLLKTIDVRNCSGLGDISQQGHTQQAVDISGCSIIENVYFDGTNITGITLPNGGVLKVLHLPATITNLTILNQPSISDLTVASYNNISTLRLENVPTVDTKEILMDIPEESRVRLIGFSWEAEDATEITSILAHLDTMRGLDENGNNLDNATTSVSGTIHTEILSGEDFDSFERYPYINFTADHTTTTLTYASYDGSTIYKTVTCIDGVPQDTAPPGPTRESTAANVFTFVGWSKRANRTVPDADAETNVTSNRTIYAAFSVTGQTYQVRFYNGNTLLETIPAVVYGDTAVYSGGTPVYTEDPENYVFRGWSPSNVNIQGNTDCYAQYEYLGVITRRIIDRGIVGAYENNTITSIGERAFNYCRGLTSVTCNNVTVIGDHAFDECRGLTEVNLPNVTSIGQYSFYFCIRITSISMPELTTAGSNAFSSCQSLIEVNMPKLTKISESCFASCYRLNRVSFEKVTEIRSYAFRYCSGLTALILENTEQVVTLRDTDAFSNANNVIIYVPDELVNDYKSASNWSVYASRIKGLSELAT